MKYLEFAGMLTTLLGYYMVTHGMVEIGATVAMFSNIVWMYFGHEMKDGGAGLMLLNGVFLVINLDILGVI